MRRGIAIVGAGIGAQHLDGFAALPERFEVRWICDLDAARGQALATRAPGARWTADLSEVLADGQVELVDICLPPHLHRCPSPSPTWLPTSRLRYFRPRWRSCW